MRLTIELDKYITIAGGQFCDEAGCVDEYYLKFKDADIEMNSETLKKMAVDAINHLIVNGHRFDFCFTDIGEKKLVDKERV